MPKRLISLALICLALSTSHVTSQSRFDAEAIERRGPAVSTEWKVFTGIDSSTIAHEGAELLTSSGVSLPDGTQAIVTFWKPAEPSYLRFNVIRCVDYFDGFMQRVGSGCAVPREKEK